MISEVEIAHDEPKVRMECARRPNPIPTVRCIVLAPAQYAEAEREGGLGGTYDEDSATHLLEFHQW